MCVYIYIYVYIQIPKRLHVGLPVAAADFAAAAAAAAAALSFLRRYNLVSSRSTNRAYCGYYDILGFSIITEHRVPIMSTSLLLYGITIITYKTCV